MALFQERLRACREAAGISQQELADLLGIGIVPYRRYELQFANPPLTSLVILARRFNVSLDFLTGRSDDPTPPKRLRIIRQRQGLTQKQVSERLNMTPSSVGQYERGDLNPKLRHLLLLASLLGISLDVLVGLEPMQQEFEADRMSGRSSIRAPFHAMLSQFMRKHEVSDDILAAYLGIGARGFSYYTSGKREPLLQHLIAIADFFDTTVDDLLGRVRQD